MSDSFLKVKRHLLDLNIPITSEYEEKGIFIINNPDAGLHNLVIGCADPLLIIEQLIIELPELRVEVLSEILKKNRDIIHGAFVLDESGKKLIFRDTLQIENLDLNEIEASINSLSLLLSEFYQRLIEFTKQPAHESH